MPKHIKNTTTGQEMEVFYAFDGEKVRTIAPQGERIYLGGMEYLAGAKQHYTHAEGRMTYEVDHNVEKSFIQYKIADHLGNMLVLFGDKDDDRKINTETDVAATDDGDPNTPPTVQLEIVQRHFYYAYGMEMEGGWQHTPDLSSAYRYNGKELLGDLGMDLSDYGFRWYDPTIGRWGQVDPLSEEYLEWSPFNYVLGNPMLNIDMKGDSSTPTAPTILPLTPNSNTPTTTAGSSTTPPAQRSVLDRIDGATNTVGTLSDIMDFVIEKTQDATEKTTKTMNGALKKIGVFTAVVSVGKSGLDFIENPTVGGAAKVIWNVVIVKRGGAAGGIADGFFEMSGYKDKMFQAIDNTRFVKTYNESVKATFKKKK